MKIKNFLTVGILAALFFGFGCQKDTSETEHVALKQTVYTAFIINVHDWVYPEQSIATLNKIINISEEYQTPIDIHLDDQIVQIYKEQAPDLLERLKTSPYVAVSYHLRPPSPYFWDWDWLGLEEMDDETLYSTIKNYEEHKIDLATGQSTDEPGGYELLKELMGYPSFVVSGAGTNRRVRAAADQVWLEKGAIFVVKHNETTGWGEKLDGLWLRPEDLEVKVYEKRGHVATEDMMADALAELPETRPVFLNLKWHENNFYTWKPAWDIVYKSKEPPFDLSTASAEVKNEEEQAEEWMRFEGAIVYVKNHPEIFTAINARDLAGMIE